MGEIRELWSCGGDVYALMRATHWEAWRALQGNLHVPLWREVVPMFSSRLAPCTRIALNVVACLGGLEQGGIRYWRHTENAIKAR
ncbi:hypothetical protein TcWFU_009698 [Taenia crassiceps]|uniref:Uncharacterized protein n=1 Tax=Taenia crassiceps TaxID=6207 RepID=A0ABR4QIK8_9CEST